MAGQNGLLFLVYALRLRTFMFPGFCNTNNLNVNVTINLKSIHKVYIQNLTISTLITCEIDL